MSESDETLLAEGTIVRSTAGRDRGTLYVVMGSVDGHFVLVADGRVRPVKHPKRKNVKHLRVVAGDHAAPAVSARGRPPADEMLRTMLASVEKGGGRSDGTQG